MTILHAQSGPNGSSTAASTRARHNVGTGSQGSQQGSAGTGQAR